MRIDIDVLSLVLIIGILLLLLLMTMYFIIPYIKLQLRRRESRLHMPQPEELWMQDGALLYIDNVNTTGVELMSFDHDTKQFHKWKDTWEEWNRRLKVRTVWYTGQRQSLGSQ